MLIGPSDPLALISTVGVDPAETVTVLLSWALVLSAAVQIKVKVVSAVMALLAWEPDVALAPFHAALAGLAEALQDTVLVELHVKVVVPPEVTEAGLTFKLTVGTEDPVVGPLTPLTVKLQLME